MLSVRVKVRIIEGFGALQGSGRSSEFGVLKPQKYMRVDMQYPQVLPHVLLDIRKKVGAGAFF